LHDAKAGQRVAYNEAFAWTLHHPIQAEVVIVYVRVNEPLRRLIGALKRPRQRAIVNAIGRKGSNPTAAVHDACDEMRLLLVVYPRLDRVVTPGGRSIIVMLDQCGTTETWCELYR